MVNYNAAHAGMDDGVVWAPVPPGESLVFDCSILLDTRNMCKFHSDLI